MRLVKNDTYWSDPFADFDTFVNRALARPDLSSDWFRQLAGESVRGFRMDSFHDKDNYYLVAELPGVKKSDVNVELEGSVLTIAVNKLGRDGAEGPKAARSVTISDEVDGGNVSAKLENGLLTITLPKHEQKKPQLVQIA